MRLTLYQVDAFAESVFAGNPAAVCILDQWIDDALMQQIAGENNLSETAFLVPANEGYHIRWFTPEIEVDLCGHATLASGFVVLEQVDKTATSVAFYSPRSGPLSVSKSGSDLVLDFPVDTLEEIAGNTALNNAIGRVPVRTFKGKTDLMLVYESQSEIEQIKPDFNALLSMDIRGVIVTAPGTSVDFVSRFFAPQAGINEDPVTGSAHTTMVPYWAEVLDKKELRAKQLSARGGNLHCQLEGDRVKIAGKAVLYMKGEIFV